MFTFTSGVVDFLYSVTSGEPVDLYVDFCTLGRHALEPGAGTRAGTAVKCDVIGTVSGRRF